MSKDKKIKSNVRQQRNVKNTVDWISVDEINTYLRKNRNVVFDFSAGKSFCSCRTNQFDNHLSGVSDFIEKFKELIDVIGKLSQHRVSELFDNNNNFRHCHSIVDKDCVARNVIDALYSDDDYVKQFCEGEKLYQAGYDKGVRLVGILKTNVFYVVFVDYFHDLYPDDKKNIRSKKTHNYSISI